MEPLANTLRPKTLEQFIGQTHLLGPNAPLRTQITNDQITSLILYGPSGTGKTTIAEIISNTTKKPITKLNATSLKITDIRDTGDQARKTKTPTILYIDEIHRATTTQQAALFPYLEDGTLILISGTTENPYHTLHQALISRSIIYKLEPLTKKELIQILSNALEHTNKMKQLNFETDAIKQLINNSNGDARKLLTTLQTLLITTNKKTITKEDINNIHPHKSQRYCEDDKYDYISWMQGAIQASDPDAAVYALARLLESGEDLKYIARRILVSASEDACSNPNAAIIANNAYIAACSIGRPEADIILSHAVITIAQSPRNKTAANAIWTAIDNIKNNQIIEVPKTMKDCHYPGASKLGNGQYHDGKNQQHYVGINKKYVENKIVN